MKKTMHTTMGTSYKQPWEQHTNNAKTTSSEFYMNSDEQKAWSALALHIFWCCSYNTQAPAYTKIKICCQCGHCRLSFHNPTLQSGHWKLHLQCASNVHHVACNCKFGVLMCSIKVCVIYVLFCD